MQAWIQKIFQSLADKYYLDDVRRIVQSTRSITELTYPRLFANLQACCQILHMVTPPTLYVTPSIAGINALSVQYDGQIIILLSPQVVALSDEEQCFILGHELGHCRQGNMAAHVVLGLLDTIHNKTEILGPLLEDAVNVPLKEWFRRMEFEADEAGYLCAPDMDMVHALFTRLGMKEQITGFESYAEVDATHPLLLTRFNELSKRIAL